MSKKHELEGLSWKCSICGSTEIELAIYHPTCIGYIQLPEGIKALNYLDIDDTEKIQCFQCGDRIGNNIEPIDE